MNYILIVIDLLEVGLLIDNFVNSMSAFFKKIGKNKIDREKFNVFNKNRVDV